MITKISVSPNKALCVEARFCQIQSHKGNAGPDFPAIVQSIVKVSSVQEVFLFSYHMAAVSQQKFYQRIFTICLLIFWFNLNMFIT